MVRNKLGNRIAQGLIIAFGSFIFWHFNLFRPVNLFYPPPNQFQLLPGDSVLASPGAHYGGSFFKIFWLGEHLRPLWTTPVKVRLFRDLVEKQKLKAIKKGGGMQTTRFTLEDPSGREYSLRSVDKNPAAVLYKVFWPTVGLGFVRDQIAATDPYAMFVVAELARNADISRAEPRLVYVAAHEPALGNLAGRSQGFFSLVPRLEDPEWLAQPGETFIKMYETDKMQVKLQEQHSGMYPDTARYLRCRLFDLLIGDWDRHAGQWDWLAFSGENHTIFRPVPKDRDQAMGFYQDGIIPWILSRRFALRKISSFTENYEDVDGFLQNGRPVDQWLLKDLPESDYVAMAIKLKGALTDEVLADAVKAYPQVFAETRAREVYDKLKKRRDKLPEAARLFYQNVQEEN